MPLLDVLQSVPILSFLPVVLLSLTAILPQALAAELAAIVLIFTSQAWNMTFSFYQSMTTIPAELREAAAIFRFESVAALQDAGAALCGARPDLEQHDELGGRLVLSDGGGDLSPSGRATSACRGLAPTCRRRQRREICARSWRGRHAGRWSSSLLDQLVWRPLLAWADKFKVEMVGGGRRADVVVPAMLLSPLLAGRAVRSSRVSASPRASGSTTGSARPRPDRVQPATSRKLHGRPADRHHRNRRGHRRWSSSTERYRAGDPAGADLAGRDVADGWAGRAGHALRVAVALAIALLWTVPVGVAIGTNRTARGDPAADRAGRRLGAGHGALPGPAAGACFTLPAG